MSHNSSHDLDFLSHTYDIGFRIYQDKVLSFNCWISLNKI